MKHRPLLFLVLPLLLLAMTLFGVRSWSGSSDVASAHVDTETPHIEIDLVKEAGEDWCESITTSASRAADGTPYQIAVCLSDSADADGAPITLGAFQFDLLYNPQLNSCTDTGSSASPALDANPNANDGTTSFSTPDLGTGWDCNILSSAPPTCAKGGVAGRAFIKCQCVSTAGCTSTLPTGAGVSAPLAVVTLAAIAGGVDNLNLVNGHVFDTVAGGILDCPAAGGAPCYGAAETKEGELPEPTATFTPAPTATATPTCGGPRQEPCPTSTPTAKAKTRTPTPEATGTPAPGEPTSAPPPPPPPPSGGQQPVVVPPATGTGSGGIGWTGILMWTLAGGAASLVLGGGLYLRRVTNR